MTTQTIATHDGLSLAYRHTPGAQPGVLFLGGYRSDMNGTKAQALEAHCRAQGRQFTRFDYRGHGESDGEFLDATVTNWRDDAITVLDHVTTGPQLLVGSSMGGHIMLLAALARPDRVAGLVGIAAAPDFTEKLMWERGGDERRAELEEKGVIWLPSDYDEQPYPITMKLIEDGRSHLLLEDEIPLDLPVALLHGVMDEDVPWEYAMLLAAQLRSTQVDIHIRKDADHRFSREQDIVLLCDCVERMAALSSSVYSI